MRKKSAPVGALVSSVFNTCASILARRHCGSVHYVESRVKRERLEDLCQLKNIP